MTSQKIEGWNIFSTQGGLGEDGDYNFSLSSVDLEALKSKLYALDLEWYDFFHGDNSPLNQKEFYMSYRQMQEMMYTKNMTDHTHKTGVVLPARKYKEAKKVQTEDLGWT